MTDPVDDLVKKALGAIDKLDADWANRLNDAGLETWEGDDETLAHSNRLGVADSHTGASVSLVSWQGSETRPAGYPADWPFLPDEDVSLLEAAPALLWDTVDDVEDAVRRIAEQLVESGWRERPWDSIPAGVQSCRWFSKDDVWRVLTTYEIHGTDGEVAVALGEKRSQSAT